MALTITRPFRLLLSLWLSVWLLTAAYGVQALQCDADPGGTGSSTAPGGDMTGSNPGQIQYYQPSNGTVAAGATQLTLTATPAGLAANNMVLIIQMQGADINSADTNSYGDGVSGDPASGQSSTNFTAGYYEYAAIASISGSTIRFKNALIHGYQRANYGTQGQRRYQVIRVPQYKNLTLGGNITAKAWDGNTGGVLPLDVSGTLNFNGYAIDMSEKGFRGGGGRNHDGNNNTGGSYRFNSSNNDGWSGGSKGEGIAGTPRYTWNGTSANRTNNGAEGYPNGSYGMGAPGNAGGGGTDGHPAANDENSGGGGGGNGGAGGRGGNSWNSNLPVGGFGGAAFPFSANRLVMGGGGGAGTMNNNTAGTYGGPHGGVGGGIILIRAGTLSGTGTINANGGGGITPLNDGAGGGGAGGSVLVIANSQTGSLTINAKGGNGGDVDYGDPHGPGGGGGGGVILTNSAVSAMTDSSQGQSGQAGDGSEEWPYQYYGASPIGGGSGSGSVNTPPDDIDGTSPGASCQQYESDLSVTKTRNSGSMVAGGTVQFKISVANNGPDTTRSAATISVSDILDSRFTFTNATGSNWSCSGAPNLVCNYASTLANGATAPDLLINATISSTAFGQNVSNTANVSIAAGHNNSDPVSTNNSSTINDIIYNLPAAGSKWLYTYPASSNRKLSRVVPTASYQTLLTKGTSIDLLLDPALTGNLNINGNVIGRLCMDAETGSFQNTRVIHVSLWQGTPPGGTQIGSTAEANFSNDNWQYYIFNINHSGTTTVNSGTGLYLRIENASSGSGNYDARISTNYNGADCPSDNVSHIEIDTNTVINVDSVTVYDAPYPLGNVLTRMVQGQTVYIRSAVSDPFGYADVNNNSVVDIMNGTTVVSGPHAQSNIISQSGNTKQFEYQVTLPGAPNLGSFDARVTANEGTEGEISHVARTAFELTSNPDLSVTKSANKTNASPGDDIEYTVLVANNQASSTGNAHSVVISDKLPAFVKLKVNSTPVIDFIDAPTPHVSSTVTVGSTQYSNDNGATWTYTPSPDGQGFDANITNFKMTLTGSVPPNGAFQLKYTVRLK